MKQTIKMIVAISLLSLLSLSSYAGGNKYKHYKVTITNITKGQSFTPLILASHKSSMQLFELGEMASPELARVAEGGDIEPLASKLEYSRKVKDVAHSDGLLEPGHSVEIMIKSKNKYSRLSLAAMLLPTNDTFVALNGIHLPSGGSRTVFARAYDAGSETNDEYCASIPGPHCGGAPFSPEDEGEGFVHIASGIHGNGELAPSLYDWRGAVARVVIERM